MPIGTLTHSKIPFFVTNAVQCADSSSIAVWKNPDVKSMIAKNFGLCSPMFLNNSPMCGIGHLSTLVVALFKPLKSKTNLHSPLGFGTRKA